MPWGPRPASNFRARAGAIAVVIGGHVAMFLLLTTDRERDAEPSADDRMTLVFIDPLDVRPPPAPPAAPRPARPASRAVAPPASITAPDAAAATSPAISPGIDWYANGSDAARRATTAPETRDFGMPKREPAPRTKKPFGWDKTHTERVHALDGGGLGVHLSDNCELTLAPLPMVGCGLGKRKARGDLFDEMKAPPQMGDWK